ncbi:MAG: DUF1501 domain-containing protein [Flavobacteriales bacterium]|nr:MAG: DUF1501 domain-containing protein [Flavobacteriales bacterium]
MRRRSFLRTTSAATLGGFAVRGFGDPLLGPLFDRSGEDRVLVIVQLYGGNDGLNTVIPLDQYSTLSNVRANVLIPENAVLDLPGISGTGLHPALAGLRELWQNGKLNIVQGVGYPNPDFSHFRSTDIWETGANSDQLLASGWTGRYLHFEYPNYPNGFPNATMPDPLAIRIGAPISIGLQHQGVAMGASIYNTDDPLNLTGNLFTDPTTPDCMGAKLDFVRTVQRQADLYGDVIQAAALPGCNLSTLYPTGTQPGAQLANALKVVAQLICGGLKTRIYWVGIDGFDTHAQQVVAGNPTTGKHAELLQGVGNSIRAFQNDLELLGLDDRVIGMTFSEFGRRIKSNASIGTDHGTAAPLFLFGTHVLPGMLGTNPVIPANTTYDTNLPMQYDFRSVYASVLKDWFCLDPADVDQVLLDTYQPLALVDPQGCMGTSIHEANNRAGTSLLEVYPSPFTDLVTIRFNTNGDRTLIQIFSENGQVIRTLHNGPLAPGEHRMQANLTDLAPGAYYCRVQYGMQQQVKALIKMR